MTQTYQQIEELELLADQYGVDLRLTKTEGRYWNARLTHDELRQPIATGYGDTLTEAVADLHRKAERVLGEKREEIAKAVTKRLRETRHAATRMMKGLSA